MAKLANRAKMTISSTGTGNITLAAADTGYQTFAQAGISDNDVIRYIVEDASNAWEIGTAVVSNSSTVLARTVEESSSGGSALNLTSAAKVFVGITAKDLDGNVAPQFLTTPPTSLALSNDGSTAVTLNVKAYDEQGFPVAYTWDANIAGSNTIYDASSLPPQFASAPSINQSTGVFSIIGSSSSSNGGTVNFRAKASDGVKVATHVASLSLSFAFDIANATYNNVSFSIASQEANATSLAFNSAGTKMYVVGYSSDTVFQYSLSTAFDVSTASYDNVSLSVSSQDSDPNELCFNSTGTKMFILGQDNGAVFQYSLSTGFDLSTASYDNVSFTLQANSYELGLAFSTNGTRFFVVNSSNDLVEQYSCSTGFDVSTASFDSKSFSVASQDGDPSALAFNGSGTKMYMLGYANDTVFQYGLSTAFDVSTASYDSVSFSVGTQLSRPQGLAFGGNKMFLTGRSSDKVFEYDL